jgi:hypothetical protein
MQRIHGSGRSTAGSMEINDSDDINGTNDAFQPDLIAVHAINPVSCLKIFLPERKTPRLGYLCKRIVSYCHGNVKRNFTTRRYSLA